MHLNAEQTGRAALPNIGGKLSGHDDVALGWTSLPQGDLGREAIAGGAVAVASRHRLHDGLHGFALPSACGMIVIHAGQHVLEGEGTVGDAVGRVPKAHGEVGGRETPEEGGHQRGHGAFHTACPTQQREDELGLMPDLTEELVERGEEHEGEAGVGHLHGDQVVTEEIRKLRVINLPDGGFQEVPLLLSLELNVVFSRAGHQILPLAADLFPAREGKNGFLLGILARTLDSVAHVLFHLGDDLQVEGCIEAVVNPIHLFQLGRVDLELGQGTTVFIHTADAVFLGLFRAVVDGQLADDFGREIAEADVKLTLFGHVYLGEASVHFFVGSRIDAFRSV